MDIQINFFSLILLLGFFQGVFLSIVLLSKPLKERKSSHVFFATLLVVFSIIMLDQSTRKSNLYLSIPHFLYISDALWYLIAPLLYFFVISSTGSFLLKWQHVLHGVPFLIFFLIYFKLLAAPATLKVEILENHIASGGEFLPLIKFFILIMMLQIMGYFLASIVHLKKYERKYKELFSDNDIDYLVHIKDVIWFFTTYFLLEFSISTYRNFLDLDNKLIQDWSLIVWVLFIMTVSFVMIRRPKLLSYVPMQKLVIKPVNNNFDFEKTSKKLVDYISKSKIFLTSDLTLTELAEKVSLSPHQLSFVLNNYLKTNFYEFVNTYRVKEVAKELKLGKHNQYSIFGIAQSKGFKSKASFYRIFKEHYGMTPTRFISEVIP